MGSSAYGQKVLDSIEMTEHACLYYSLSSVVEFVGSFISLARILSQGQRLHLLLFCRQEIFSLGLSRW